jgi:hypothetical protein
MNMRMLIDKLTDIQLSIGVEEDLSIRNKVIDIQDCLLQMQRERADSFRIRSCRSDVLATGWAFFHALASLLGRRRAFAAARPSSATSSLSRR